jgi:hypothetical protein
MIWRILTGGVRAERKDAGPRRAIRPVFAVLWLCGIALAFLAGFWLGLFTLGLFLVGLFQSR